MCAAPAVPEGLVVPAKRKASEPALGPPEAKLKERAESTSLSETGLVLLPSVTFESLPEEVIKHLIVPFMSVEDLAVSG